MGPLPVLVICTASAIFWIIAAIWTLLTFWPVNPVLTVICMLAFLGMIASNVTTIWELWSTRYGA